MFDIGFQELIIIFIVALLVFGPEKLPEVGRTLGKWMIEIRKGIQNAKNQMDSEFSELEKNAQPPSESPSYPTPNTENNAVGTAGTPADDKEKK